MDSAKLATGIAILVSAVWTISFIADILIKDYDPSPFVHVAMMAIVGAITGNAVFGKKSEKRDG